MGMRTFPAIAAMLLTVLPAVVNRTSAQQRNPVQWKVAPDKLALEPGISGLLRVQARLEPGWHIYSLSTPEGGPMPTTVKLEPPAALSTVDYYQPKPKVKFDPNFKTDAEIFETEVDFVVDLRAAPKAEPGSYPLNLLVRYQACTETECLPRKAALTAELTIARASGSTAAASTGSAVPAGWVKFDGKRSVSRSAQASQTTNADPAGTTPVDTTGLIAFLLVAFGFGLAAIFTPCVFPMIPITISVFLNREGATWSDGIKQALLFCGGIVVLFTAMGLAVTALLGPFGVVQLGANPWVNAFIALVFLVFGLSLLGAFEITLPSSLLTRVDRMSQGSGSAATLLMGLTFSLTSFACVGPFVGTLLAGSVQGGGARPVLGMMAFATGLASPFFLLAAFPSFLRRLPRSGGWLARVKVTLGFIVLAAMLKFLSTIDQALQLDILTRDRFLAAWFVLFGLAGLYLLGLLKLEGVRPDETVGVGRLLTGAAFLMFAFSLLPGMFGARLGELDAYVPLATESNSLTGSQAGAASKPAWYKNDFDAAAAAARAENKLVFVSFTGYACTNCHWMKANMLPRPEIAAELNRFVLVELYTDGTDAVSERNQELQEKRFGTVAIPFYAIMTPDGQVVKTFAGATRKTEEYRAFLASATTERAALQP